MTAEWVDQAVGRRKNHLKQTSSLSESLVLLPFNICKIDVAPTNKIIFLGNTLNFLHVFFTTTTDLRLGTVSFLSVLRRGRFLKALNGWWLLYILLNDLQKLKRYFTWFIIVQSQYKYLSEKLGQQAKWPFYLTSEDDRKSTHFAVLLFDQIYNTWKTTISSYDGSYQFSLIVLRWIV